MTPSAAPKAPRILFVAGNRLGDAVLSSSVLARLLDEQPGARVTVACGVLPASLFADVPGLDRIIVMRRRRYGMHWLALWRACATTRWDTVADLRSSILCWTLRARRRLVSYPEYRHEHRILEIARQFRLDPPPEPRLWIAPARAARVAAWLGVDQGDARPILAVAPAANWGGKQWPAERFAATVRRLIGPGGSLAGARVAIAAAETERASVRLVVDAVPESQRIDLVGVADLLDVGAALARCTLFIGNDSGLMHIAAAVGVPTLGLFGPSPDWRYSPWGAKTAVVRTPESFEALTTGTPGFEWARQESLMGGLSVDAVVDAAEGLLRRSGPVNAGSGAAP